ncbi:hypothetical protein LTR78_006806 [Recurvomyces mirabilis]|uniref:Uncharacterized protein n=1 Tax=Recurvomyces mirabilis TaxID=574656 RepID=A0AAE0WK95_9PEZI|nr:hypothetical protein LTR78_006806 [Recurvomyces mirabilis]KAK5153204.1 hypothetical protein LTS14_007849 [Recurvomyces mirabilis]
MSTTSGPSSSATISTILVRPVPQDPTNQTTIQTVYTPHTISQNDSSGLEWIASPISATLGLPLKAARYPGENGKVPNKILLGLFLHTDPEDLETFGKIRYRKMTGSVVLARVDEQAMTIQDVEPLLTYLNSVSAELYQYCKAEFANEDERKRKAKELAAHLLTREAYERWRAGRQ